MAETITIRPLEREDLPEVLDLLRAALGEPPWRTPESFAWKHYDNPFGVSLALVAETSGRLVGLRALMRWELTTPTGETLRCLRAVDTATHPEFQRRGIFRRLTEEAVELARGEGIDLIFNTPNPRSGAGYLSMGWVEVGAVGVLVRPSWRLVVGGGPANLEDLLTDPVPAFPVEVEDRAPLGLRTPRTEAYLKWRYASHPTARYFRIDAKDSVAVVRPNTRNGNPELIVVDVYGPHPSAPLRRAARSAKAAYTAAWFSPGAPERSAALSAGLLPVPRFKALTLMARPLKTLPYDVSSMENWDLTISDLELL